MAKVVLGNCLDVLRSQPSDSIDAIVTDPPYGLGTKEPTPEQIEAYLKGASLGPLKKGRQHCANRLAGVPTVREALHSEAHPGQDFVTFRILVGAVAVGPKPVEFQDQPLVREQEVHAESCRGGLDDVLMDEGDPKLCEPSDNGLLCLREHQGFSGCVEVCRCFAQTGPTTFRVLIRLYDDSPCDSQRPGCIVATRATEERAVLTLDVGRRTGELVAADAADVLDAGLLLDAPQGVGALPAASGLLARLKVLLRGEVGFPTDRAVAFDVSVPTAVLDRLHSPHVPQKDFMGKAWEIPSVEIWQECFRVLKPGRHICCFAATRTWDIMLAGMEAAGFIREGALGEPFGEMPLLSWLHGQGFPKSQNFLKTGIVPEIERQLRDQGVEGEIQWRK